MTSAVATTQPRSASPSTVAVPSGARRVLAIAAIAAAGVAVALLLPGVALAALVLGGPMALVALLAEGAGSGVADDPELVRGILGLPSPIR